MFIRQLKIVASNARWFTTSTLKSQKDFQIPLTSQALNPRFLSQTNFMTNYQEDAIIELLQDITPELPVPSPEFPYFEMADRPWKEKLPLVPTDASAESLNQYVDLLTSFRYHQSTTRVIEECLLDIVSKQPELLNKKSYLGIVGHFHFLVQDHKAFQIINTMEEKTDMKQDVDFDNYLLSFSNTKTEYEHRIKRLENLKEHKIFANTGTWYSIFRVFKTTAPKLTLLELMDEYQISHEPIRRSALHTLAKELTPQELVEYYKKEGVYNELDPYLLNRLLECHLRNNQIEEAWELLNEVHSRKINNVPANVGAFVAFMNFFLKRNQVNFCFAFSDLFNKTFDIKTRNVLANHLLSNYLTTCNYFQNWGSLVKVLVDLLVNHSDNKTFINDHQIRALKNHAKIHGLRNFNPFAVSKQDLVLEDTLLRDLKWDDLKMNINLQSNTQEFKRASSLINAKYRPKKPKYSPTDLLD